MQITDYRHINIDYKDTLFFNNFATGTVNDCVIWKLFNYKFLLSV